MTKDELYKKIAGKVGMHASTVRSILTCTAEVLYAELQAGQEITLPNIAKFSVKEKPATPTRTVRTFGGGTSVITAKPAHNIVCVKPVKSLRIAVMKGV